YSEDLILDGTIQGTSWRNFNGPSSGVMNIGQSNPGDYNIDAAEFARLLDGSNSMQFNNYGGSIAVGSITIDDDINVRADDVTIDGIVDTNGHNFIIAPMDGFAFGAGGSLEGTGFVNITAFMPGSLDISIGNNVGGTINISDAMLAKFSDDLGLLQFSRFQGGTITVDTAYEFGG